MAKRIIQTHFCLALVLSGGLVGCATNAPNHPSGLPLRYYNSQYDFTFFLPASWRGYSVLIQQWNASQTDSTMPEHGPVIVIRHPQWKINDIYQDIPVRVFTRSQWEADRHGKFAIDAGGFEEEIEHNREFVFVISSRFNTEELKASKEADDVVTQNRNVNAPPLYPEP